jgi:hypothetical protein
MEDGGLLPPQLLFKDTLQVRYEKLQVSRSYRPVVRPTVSIIVSMNVTKSQPSIEAFTDLLDSTCSLIIPERSNVADDRFDPTLLWT